jgi:hypothetical protein
LFDFSWRFHYDPTMKRTRQWRPDPGWAILFSAWSIALTSGSIARAELLYFGSGNGISTYETTTDQIGPGITISGIDFIRSIDFRPSNGQLYAVGGSSELQLFTINLTSGTANPVGGPLGSLSSATALDMAFDPTTDRLRIVADSGAHLLVDPATGGVLQTGPTLAVLGIGYAGPVLYGLSNSWLVTVNPMDGSLAPVGDTTQQPVPVFGFGFAASGVTGKAYGYYDTPFGVPEGELYEIDLATAQARLLRSSAIFIPSVAVAPVPEPTTITLTAVAVGLFLLRGFLRRRRRENALTNAVPRQPISCQ